LRAAPCENAGRPSDSAGVAERNPAQLVRRDELRSPKGWFYDVTPSIAPGKWQNANTMKTLLAFLLVLLLAAPAHADRTAVAGTWLSEDGDGLIEIRLDGDDLNGTILGSPNEDPDRPKTDVHNPDPALRDQPLIGLNIFSSFTYDGNGSWSGGFVYDPNSGKTYRAKLKLTSQNTLKLRGYIGISLLGRTETWTRRTD